VVVLPDSTSLTGGSPRRKLLVSGKLPVGAAPQDRPA
jgi:hypothetical protein